MTIAREACFKNGDYSREDPKPRTCACAAFPFDRANPRKVLCPWIPKAEVAGRTVFKKAMRLVRPVRVRLFGGLVVPSLAPRHKFSSLSSSFNLILTPSHQSSYERHLWQRLQIRHRIHDVSNMSWFSDSHVSGGGAQYAFDILHDSGHRRWFITHTHSLAWLLA